MDFKARTTSIVLGPSPGKNLQGYDIFCFSHLRWNFVFQRPQHLMSRFSLNNQVIYWEEPIYKNDLSSARLNLHRCPITQVMVATPELPSRLEPANVDEALAALPELRGKDLVCWCAPEACHGDVLLELANASGTAGAQGL